MMAPGLVGWQRQDNGPSVQAYLEAAAKKLTNQPTPIQGSGRTDAGVHACAQAAHLDVPASLNSYAVVNGLNAWLETRQISVLSAQPVGSEFHARFDATERGYLYRILDRPIPASFAPPTCLAPPQKA
jgi:tRNA pseudouridine38-40 synthase